MTKFRIGKLEGEAHWSSVSGEAVVNTTCHYTQLNNFIKNISQSVIGGRAHAWKYLTLRRAFGAYIISGPSDCINAVFGLNL